MIALIPWLLVVLLLVGVVRVQDYGYAALLGCFAVAFVLIFYPFEKIMLVERRACRCTSCGYELRGLTEDRCPECGTGFDPAEQSEILARAGKPAPRGERRWIVVLLIALLAGTVAANFWMYYQVRKPRPAAPPATSPAPPATSPTEPQGQ